jgi:hypothetical protein
LILFIVSNGTFVNMYFEVVFLGRHTVPTASLGYQASLTPASQAERFDRGCWRDIVISLYGEMMK